MQTFFEGSLQVNISHHEQKTGLSLMSSLLISVIASNYRCRLFLFLLRGRTSLLALLTDLPLLSDYRKVWYWYSLFGGRI